MNLISPKPAKIESNFDTINRSFLIAQNSERLEKF